ncbi:MAG: DUF4340 domain-containing protein, partial [Pseudomonadota bacterium]
MTAKMTANGAKRMSRGARALIALAAVTAVTTALAAITVLAGSGGPRPGEEPARAFPNLETRLSEARVIEVAAGETAFHIDFDPETGWTVRERYGFPADPLAVRQTLFDLSVMELVARRTSNPDWHGALELVGPSDGGEALDVGVLDGTGEALARLLIGKTAGLAASPFGGAPRSVYVRRPDEPQTWLASGRLDPPREVEAWLRLSGVDIERADIARADVTPAEGPAYTAKRDTAEQDVFDLPAPEGRELRSATAANSLAFILTELNFADVRPRADLSQEPSARTRFALFDVATLPAVLAIRAARGEASAALAKAKGIWDGLRGRRVTAEAL